MASTAQREDPASWGRLLQLVTVGYGMAGVFMLGYVWAGVLSLTIALSYALGGIAANLALAWLLRLPRTKPQADGASAIGLYLLVNAAVHLNCMFWAPQVGGIMLIAMTGMIGIGIGALRIGRFGIMASIVAFATISATAFGLTGTRLSIPVDDWQQRLISALMLTLAFGASALLGLITARMHRQWARRHEALRTKLGLLKRIAHVDDLTKLANRRALHEQLIRRLRAANPQSFVVGLIDLDHFKDVNDRLGHAAGDLLLVEVGRRLRGEMRRGDLLARLGGDEFAVLLRDRPGEHQLRAIANRLVQSLDEPIMADGHSLQLGLSLGLVIHQDGDDQTADGLLRRADMAMYAAKSHGRHQYRIFDLGMESQIRERETLLEWVKSALRDDQLELHYQPILTVEPGKANGEARIEEVEALLRLRDTQGLHAAGKFEAVLDDPQLALPIGRFVLDAATNQLERWHKIGCNLHMGVNISPRHFLHPTFLGDLRGVLQRHPQCPPSSLTLELTEHGSELNGQLASFVVSACSRLGVRVSLDDFGTGSASLTHLQQLDVAVVKIDRSFTRNLFGEGADLGITYGILRTTQMMGLETVAEGVSTPRLAFALASMGCRKLQGFAIAHPMPACELGAWLATWGQTVPWTSVLVDQKPISSEALRAMVQHGNLMMRAASGTIGAEERARFDHPDAHLRGVLGRWCEARTGVYGHDAGFVQLRNDLEKFHAQLRNVAADPAGDPSLHNPELKALGKAVRDGFWNLLLHPIPTTGRPHSRPKQRHA